MTIKSRIFTILTVVAILTCTIIPANATENTEEYIENKETIYFENINVAVKDNEELILTTSTDANIFEKIKANQEIDILDKYFEKYEETEATIAEQMSKGTLYALSYTETPLVYVEDHYERATTSDNSMYSEVDETLRQKYNFSLSTAIIRTGAPNETSGEYTYFGLTTGEWSDHSIFGGKKYPASGMDSIVQTVSDSDMTLNTCGLIVTYLDTNVTGDDSEYVEIQEGEANSGNYLSITNVSPTLIQYEVKDDPFGDLSMSSFILATEYFSQAKNTSRQICSAYTHTWLMMTVDASLQAGAELDLNIGESTEQDGKDIFALDIGLVLVIDPSLSTGKWTIFSFTAFNF